MDGDTIKSIWKSVAFIFCCLFIVVGYYNVATIGKTTASEREAVAADQAKQAQMQLCIDGGGSYIKDGCIKVRCSP